MKKNKLIKLIAAGGAILGVSVVLPVVLASCSKKDGGGGHVDRKYFNFDSNSFTLGGSTFEQNTGMKIGLMKDAGNGALGFCVDVVPTISLYLIADSNQVDSATGCYEVWIWTESTNPIDEGEYPIEFHTIVFDNNGQTLGSEDLYFTLTILY